MFVWTLHGLYSILLYLIHSNRILFLNTFANAFSFDGFALLISLTPSLDNNVNKVWDVDNAQTAMALGSKERGAHLRVRTGLIEGQRRLG